VKIRARSLFCTPYSRNGAGRAGFGPLTSFAKPRPNYLKFQNLSYTRISTTLHSRAQPCTGCTQAGCVSHLREDTLRVQSQRIQFKKD
jgi:hypothetical protein